MSKSFSLFECLEPRQLMAASPAKFSAATFFFNDVKASASGGNGTSPSQTLSVRNSGTTTLAIKSLKLGGSNASEFVLTGGPTSISAGATKTFKLAFKANATGIRTATLTVTTDFSKNPTSTVNLRGLGTAGTGGNLEPSLQRILDLFQIPVKVGDNNPGDTTLPVPPGASDEVSMQRMTKAGTGSVSLSLLAVFDNFKSPATAVSWYGATSATNKQLFTVPQSDAQSVHPSTSGAKSFDPGSAAFGIDTLFPAFSGRLAYSEDKLNTWETNTSKQKKIRFYPLKNADGTKVANAFIFAAEDYNKAYDFNDVVGIIRNVKMSTSASTTPPPTEPPPVSDGTGTGVSNINGGGAAIGTSGG